MQKEFPKYFEHIKLHPRLLIGKQVPAIGKEGTELIRDSADAADWQAAVKQALTEEIRDRAQRAFEGDSEVLRTVHQSIELFQNNGDLVPGTKEFDHELAARFTALAKPYELRVDGKLHGYSIPVQPLVNQVRQTLTAERAAKAAAPAAQPAAPAPGAAQGQAAPVTAAPAPAPVPAAPGPQAGIPAKPGQASETEDFSTLFSTLGSGWAGMRI